MIPGGWLACTGEREPPTSSLSSFRAGLGEEGRAQLYRELTETSPARCIGQSKYTANAVAFWVTNTFMPGATLEVDGGEVLV